MSIRDLVLGALLLFALSSIGCASHTKRAEPVAEIPVAVQPVIEPAPVPVVEPAPAPASIPECSHLNEYAEPEPSKQSYEAGKKAMYESFRNYLIDACVRGGCGINMPQYYQLDINIAGESR